MASLGVVGGMGALVGAILFLALFHGEEAMVAGGLIGFLLAWNVSLSRLLGRLDKKLQHHDELLAARPAQAGQEEGADQELPVLALEEVDDQPGQATGAPTPEPVPTPAAAQDAQPAFAAGRQSEPAGGAEAPDRLDPLSRLAAVLKAFFTEGNVVLRVGLLVLFFGVAFLLKYAAERSILPIELRLVGVVIGGLALLGMGWRLRLSRPGFALLVQGGGIGLLFLTVFAAAKLYQLLPMPLSFGIMVGLVATSAALALLQDAKSLALFGATGGFLAPVLLSTGSGSHVALFSYYALLNSGILAIAWFKAWRELNLLGFVFTLGIGSLWGARSYQPQFFASTEPFLILFFLMFSMIAVLFAFRQPPHLRGYVDGSLVFGTPIICFSLQAALVRDMQYGMAISALAVSIFYVGLATLLWNRGDDRVRQGMRTLTEAFLALGVVFATLAVPLALSGNWTAVTWAMEGAALIWVGVRQYRLVPRNFGALLQVGAALVFLNNAHFHGARPLIINGVYLGAVVISLAALFSAWQLHRADSLRTFERYHHLLLFIWGALWWFAAGINELDQQVPSLYEDHAILVFIGLSCLAMMAVARRLTWAMAAFPSLFLLPVMLLMALDNLGWHGASGGRHLFGNYGYLAWSLAFILLYRCLLLGRALLPERGLRISHVGAMLLITLIAAAEVAWLVDLLTYGAGSWTGLAWGLVPVSLVMFSHGSGVRRYWPLNQYGHQYRQQAGLVLMLLVWLWLVAGSLLDRGSATPLPYIPVVNPLELSQLVVLLAMARWGLVHRDFLTSRLPARGLLGFIGITGFIWINAVLARAVHQLRGVRFDAHHMLDSRFYQASVAILWGVLALVLTVTASRRRSRGAWFVGSGLIALTVVKLFVVDLAGSGTIERIVSFLAVGLLLMVIGYFSPLPPVRPQEVGESS